MSQKPHEPVVLYRGTTTPKAGSGETAGPGSGATVILYDATATNQSPGYNIRPCQFTRITGDIVSSHDSGALGVIVEMSDDGTQWDAAVGFPSTYTAASGRLVLDILVTSPFLRIKYTNSAASLTKWQVNILGFLGDRAKGF